MEEHEIVHTLLRVRVNENSNFWYNWLSRAAITIYWTKKCVSGQNLDFAVCFNKYFLVFPGEGFRCGDMLFLLVFWESNGLSRSIHARFCDSDSAMQPFSSVLEPC